jgi:hypothetical protein
MSRPGSRTPPEGPIHQRMPVTGRLRHRLAQLLRSERGQALPTALFAMIASFGLASAAVISSVDAQQGTARDRESKNAIAAADAGANLALLRLNRFQHDLTEATPCVGPGGESLPESNGWCPATQAEGVGGASFSYAVSAYKPETEQHETELNVVAVGTAGGVSRRVEVGLISYGGAKVFAKEHGIGQNGITFKGANGVKVRTDLGTNGNIESNSGNVSICGNIRHGTGKESPPGQPEPSCGKVTESNQNLPPITPPEGIATNNEDCRLALTCPKIGVDTYVGNKEEEKRNSKEPWDTEHTPGTINVGNNATLTMGGQNYFVCGLFVKGGGRLIMAAAPGVEVRIFVDTPEHCGLAPGAVQVEITGNTESTGYNPPEGKYAVPGIYLLGSGSVVLTGNSGTTNELLLYAPESNVEVKGNATWIGLIAGKSLNFSGSPTFESNPGLAPPKGTIQSLWERTHYVECTGAGASPPNASC